MPLGFVLLLTQSKHSKPKLEKQLVLMLEELKSDFNDKSIIRKLLTYFCWELHCGLSDIVMDAIHYFSDIL